MKHMILANVAQSSAILVIYVCPTGRRHVLKKTRCGWCAPRSFPCGTAVAVLVSLPCAWDPNSVQRSHSYVPNKKTRVAEYSGCLFCCLHFFNMFKHHFCCYHGWIVVGFSDLWSFGQVELGGQLSYCADVSRALAPRCVFFFCCFVTVVVGFDQFVEWFLMIFVYFCVINWLEKC